MPDAPPLNTAERLVDCWPAARPFAVIGAACILAGGGVAAVSRPTGFDLGPWLAAFLVLVGGAAQLALGGGQAWLADRPPTHRRVVTEVATWNAGIAVTIVGSLAMVPVVTMLGGSAVLCALALFFDAVRHSGATSSGATSSGATSRAALARRLYTGLIAVVLVSTPIGLLLAWIRHG